MAQMYPSQIDPATESRAERDLYAAFRDQLDDGYTVFHSVAWQSLDDQRRPRDGEADFVIAHPQGGILVLEVKGGGIRHDPRRGWTSIDRGGREHPIKDPFGQAQRSMHVLLDLLKTMVRGRQRFINLGYAVAVPDVDVLDANAWRFYVLGTPQLDRELGDQKSLGLARLQALCAPVRYPGLRARVDEVLNNP